MTMNTSGGGSSGFIVSHTLPITGLLRDIKSFFLRIIFFY